MFLRQSHGLLAGRRLGYHLNAGVGQHTLDTGSDDFVFIGDQ